MNARLKRVLAENPETAAPGLLAALVVADAIDGLRVSTQERELDALLARLDADIATPPPKNNMLEMFAQTIVDTLQAEVAKRRAA